MELNQVILKIFKLQNVKKKKQKVNCKMSHKNDMQNQFDYSKWRERDLQSRGDGGKELLQ